MPTDAHRELPERQEEANSATVGQYWRSKGWNLIMRSRTFGHTGEAP